MEEKCEEHNLEGASGWLSVLLILRGFLEATEVS